jgi:type III secretory pathway component EscS
MGAGIKGSAPRQVDNPPLTGDETTGLVVHVGFSTTGGWLSRMVRRFTRSRVSHCIVVYRSDIFAQEMVLEASGNGFRMISWRRWDRANKLVALYRLNFPQDDLRTALQRLADRLGDSYDTISLFGFAVRRWLRLKTVPFNSKAKLVCSEALALFLHWCGMPIDNIGAMTPQSLLHMAEMRKDTFTLIDHSAGFTRLVQRIARRQRTSRGLPAASDPPLVG